MTESPIEEPTGWFLGKIAELKNDSIRKNALIEMKSMVLNSEKKVLQDITLAVSMEGLFECLSNSDEQDIEIICVIIYELLSQMTATSLLEKYGELIHSSLFHSSEKVKETVLRLLQNNIGEALPLHYTSDTLLKQHGALLADATACVGSENRRTAQGAISLLIKLGSSAEGLNVLYSETVLDKLKEVMKTTDTARFRVYEILISVSKMSSENLSKAISSGLMENLLLEISSSDILIQLNALELLSSLGTSNHGLSYLQEHEVIQNLADKLLKFNEKQLSIMLLPGVIEFFGNLCASCPEHFTDEYPQIMDLLFNSMDTSDEVLLGVIITTVGKIGSTSSGRLVLNKYEIQFKASFLKKIGQILATKNNLTISATNCLCELVKGIDGDPKFSKIAKEWFESVTPNALYSVVNLTKLPFVEFRLAGLAFLKMIATQEWGVEKLTQHPGMIEFLTDRSEEFNKYCKQMKFEVVFNMVQCPNIEKTVNQQVLLNLRNFVREGPFYVPANVEIATEGAE